MFEDLKRAIDKGERKHKAHAMRSGPRVRGPRVILKPHLPKNPAEDVGNPIIGAIKVNQPHGKACCADCPAKGSCEPVGIRLRSH